jgi:hypothetical protein
MNKQEIKLKEKVLKNYIKERKYDESYINYRFTLIKLIKNYFKRIYNVIILPLEKQLKDFKCSIVYDENKEKIFIFLEDKDKKNHLISEITIINVAPPHIPSIKPLQLNVKYYSSSLNFDWETDKLIILGIIGNFLKKNELKINSKITKLHSKYRSDFLKKEPKLISIADKANEVVKSRQDILYPHFLDSLKKGIYFKDPFGPRDHPTYALRFKTITIDNVVSVKLTNNNEFIVTQKYRSPQDSSVIKEFTYDPIKVDDLEESIYSIFLHTTLFCNIISPNFYPQLMYENNLNMTQNA